MPEQQQSVPQSEALPSMSGGSHHRTNEGGDMNHPDGNNYDAVSANNSHHRHAEEVAAPWGSKSSTNIAYANHHHRAAPPPPSHAHGSYHLPPPRGHEPPHHHHHHHGGYHPPSYGSSPHYPYHPPPPSHDSHYPPPPTHHHAHYPPNNYNPPPPPPQMYHHHPGYYQHPPYYHHPPPHHYPTHHHHAMAPHGPYPHYSTGPPQHDIVSPPNPHTRDNDTLPSSNKPEHSMTNNTTNEQQQQRQHPRCDMQPTVNMVTPSITTTATPGESVDSNNSTTTTTTIYTPEDTALNQDSDSYSTTTANKELFTTTPHQMNDTIHDQQQQQQEEGKSKGIGSSTIFTKGLQPLQQHTVPLSADGSGGGITSNNTTYNSTTNTTYNNNSNTVTCSPYQLAQIKSLSDQAKLQIAKLKKQRKQVQQVESQRVADIAAQVDDENDGEGVGGEETVGGEGAACGGAAATTNNTTNNNKSTKKTIQKRYKDKDGFLYYRRVGTKHYKKLFEKGLVPKEYEGDEAVVERVNAIQMVSVGGGGEEMGMVVHRPPMQQEQGGGGDESVGGREEVVQECRDGDDNNGDGEVALEEEEPKEQQEQVQHNLQLPPVHQQQTQMLYSHEETTTNAMTNTTTARSDGYELRVVPHEDGNDFHVELIKPDQVQVEKKGESWKEEQQRDVGGVEEEGCSLPFMEGEALGEGGDVEEGGTTSDGSKKNAGEFDTAVDSILDAAETIAKRASPRSSPDALPQSQSQPTEDSNHLPGISSLTKRKCEDMIYEFQQEKRQRSNSVVSFNPRVYPTSNTYPYPPPDTIRPSPPSHETSFATTGPLPQTNATAGPAPPPNNAYSQIIRQDRKEKRGRRTYCYPHPSVDLTKYYSSNRQVTKTKKEELTALALCAASHIQKEPVLFRAILLNMALEREKDSPKRHAGGAPTHLKNLALKRHSSQNSDESSSAADAAFLSAVESSGKKVIRDGFFWKDVPELEKVLQKHMMEYYYMSENRPQSKKQQQFNNRLVSLVYQEAIARGFVFDPASFSLEGHSPLHFPSTTTSIECAGNWVIPPGFNHKKLRDRIRCYYKTHVQNSKKRLGTLLKNPIKDRNRDILLRLVNDLKSQEQVELSPECDVALKRLKVEQDSIKGTVSTPDGTSPDASSRPSEHSQQTTTTPYSSRATISDGGSGSSTSTSHSLQHSHAAAQQPASTTFSPFKHASLLSSMRQLDSQRH